ncbi:MAG: 50S ribosomal protein L35 [Actinomycetota bacterium]|nr:50S ribosomal protein L35 [Actinomycetota bacterium]
MPKMKTHRGAAKRFKVGPNGKIRRRKAFMNHMLDKKSSQRKRRLTVPDTIAPADRKRVRRMLGG